MKLLKLFLIAYPVFVLVDGIWLGFVMRNVYRAQIGFLTNIVNDTMQVNWPAALSVWALIVLGSIIFALPRTDGTIISGVLWGALYGIVLYGVYDLTNYALVKDWPLMITFVDMIWGATVNALLVGFLTWLSTRVY